MAKNKEAEVISMPKVEDIIKNPEPNGKKGNPETVLVMRGKIDEKLHAKLKHIDTEITRLQVELAMHQDHRNYIVNESLKGLGLDSSGKTQYTLQVDGSIVEMREVMADG